MKITKRFKKCDYCNILENDLFDHINIGWSFCPYCGGKLKKNLIIERHNQEIKLREKIKYLKQSYNKGVKHEPKS